MSVTQPTLRSLHRIDSIDLETFVPDNPTHFGFVARAMFGPSDGPGEESFDFTICTPEWIKTVVDRDSILDGRHHLIVKNFDLPKIRAFVEKYARTCTGVNWEEAATKLSRLGFWEFEDYRP